MCTQHLAVVFETVAKIKEFIFLQLFQSYKKSFIIEILTNIICVTYYYIITDITKAQSIESVIADL